MRYKTAAVEVERYCNFPTSHPFPATAVLSTRRWSKQWTRSGLSTAVVRGDLHRLWLHCEDPERFSHNMLQALGELPNLIGLDVTFPSQLLVDVGVPVPYPKVRYLRIERAGPHRTDLEDEAEWFARHLDLNRFPSLRRWTGPSYLSISISRFPYTPDYR